MYDQPSAEPMSPDGLSSAADDLHGLLAAATGLPRYAAAAEREEMKARIASHPTYPRLLQAYIDCQKASIHSFIYSFIIHSFIVCVCVYRNISLSYIAKEY